MNSEIVDANTDILTKGINTLSDEIPANSGTNSPEGSQ